MERISVIIIFLIILVLLVEFIVSSLRKGTSGLKVMIFGLNLTLFGGIVVVDINSNLGGIEYIIALLGLIISATGLGKDN